VHEGGREIERRKYGRKEVRERGRKGEGGREREKQTE